MESLIQIGLTKKSPHAITIILTCLIFSMSGSIAQDKEWEDFDPNNFDENSINIDNEWFPLKPGTRLTWEGSTIEDGEEIPHKVVFQVTDLTKVIAGINTVVCWDQDFSDEELAETELVFFAQDKDGNVWHLGQYPEEYEEGELIAAPAWLHGFEDAIAGIMMKTDPKVDTPSYSQGWGPAVGWTDRALTYKMGENVKVPYGEFKDVMVSKEWAKEEPNAFQLKFYARGVGNVKVGFLGDDPNKETLELVAFETLTGKALDKIREGALKLEKSAYKNSKNVYAHTAPAEKRPAKGSE